MDDNKNTNGAFEDFSIDDILNSINAEKEQKDHSSDGDNGAALSGDSALELTTDGAGSADGSADNESSDPLEQKGGVDSATVSFNPVGSERGKSDLFSQLKNAENAKLSDNSQQSQSLSDKNRSGSDPSDRNKNISSSKKDGKKSKEKKNKGEKKHSAIGGVIRAAIIVIVSVFIAGLLLFLISDVTGIGKEVFKGSDAESDIFISIEEGTPSISVYEDLADNGIICNAKVFQAYLKLTGKNPAINYGKHRFTKDMGYDKIISVLEETVAHAEDVSVTVRPGATVEDIAAALEKNGICKADSFIKEIQKGAKAFNSTDGILDSIPDDSDIYYQLEGYLFPETYKFYKNDDPHDVAQKMIDTLAERFTSEMRQAAEKKGYSVHDILTLASIVQLEAGDAKDSDMKKVAQVFYNRLEKWDEGGRFLQSDPTMKYQHNSEAYNTYKSEGLPPGPLCSMNFYVIKACVEPDTSCTAFYFVTDKGMNFYFNDTVDGHTNTINDLISRGMWAEG